MVPLGKNTPPDESLEARIAARRVERGIRWLNQKAPPCWHRNFFDPLPGGKQMFRGHIEYDKECPLALAFEACGEFANRFGYVTEAEVVRKFGLSPRWLRAHGFGAFRDPANVSNAVLIRAWKQALSEPRPAWRASYRHPTALDKRFAEMNFLEEPTWFERLWARVRNAFRTKTQ